MSFGKFLSTIESTPAQRASVLDLACQVCMIIWTPCHSSLGCTACVMAGSYLMHALQTFVLVLTYV